MGFVASFSSAIKSFMTICRPSIPRWWTAFSWRLLPLFGQRSFAKAFERYVQHFPQTVFVGMLGPIPQAASFSRARVSLSALAPATSATASVPLPRAVAARRSMQSFLAPCSFAFAIAFMLHSSSRPGGCLPLLDTCRLDLTTARAKHLAILEREYIVRLMAIHAGHKRLPVRPPIRPGAKHNLLSSNLEIVQEVSHLLQTDVEGQMSQLQRWICLQCIW
mmetsp:Transcript_68716/g.121402  ORF Transcript_68716/g.121402 Transcript_68716/m.121402 type:complete len:220 (+) Transcript_68716:294-953(+)